MPELSPLPPVAPPPTVPVIPNEPVISSAVERSIPPRYFPWWIPTTLALLVFAAVAGYLFYQNQILKVRLAAKPTSTPTSSPTSSADPTSTWQTYSNETYGFTFKYPKDWEQLKSDANPLFRIIKPISEKDIVEKCDQNNDCIPNADIEITIKKLPIDPVNHLSPCKLFGECLLAEKAETVTNGSTKITMEYIRKDSIYPIYSYININDQYVVRAKSYLPSTKNCIGECGQQDDSEVIKNISKEMIQILSTFKFTDQKSPDSSYTCPPTGYVDCMPALDVAKQKACSTDAMNWYKANCPNFQGGAL
jgi:hypothetical protein